MNHGEYIDLSGWYISDSKGNTFKFKTFYLNKASFVRLHTMQGIDTEYDIYWNNPSPLWTEAKPNLVLLDNFGAIIDNW